MMDLASIPVYKTKSKDNEVEIIDPENELEDLKATLSG